MGAGLVSDLTECLERFNRKERYWLIRNALGDPGAPMLLAPSFLKTLREKTKLEIPDDAWWAIDYHIDWLFGALQCFLRRDEKGAYHADLLTGSQEDFDFVVAYDRTLILIEAKATGPWRTVQCESKFERLDRLEKTLLKECGLTVKTLVLSPTPPPEKFAGMSECLGRAFSNWIELSMDGQREHFTVLKRVPGAVKPTEWQIDRVRNPGYKGPRSRMKAP